MKTTTLGLSAATALLAISSIATAQGGCDTPLTQNASQVIDGGGLWCGAPLVYLHARSFEVGAEGYQISCVRFGANVGGGVASMQAAVNIYHDTDGGPPTNPATDLDLLGSADVILDSNGMHYVNFDPPICIQPDTTFVVELAPLADITGAGYVTCASNAAGETGPTYFMSTKCGLTAYAAMADLGDFGDIQWVLTVVGGDGCDTSNTCDCGITSNCQVARPEPGCEDPLCEAIVCALEPFCCEVEWDGDCAAMSSLCGTDDSTPCDLPASNLTEAEECGDDTNGGCNMKIPAYEPIESGDTIAGTFYDDLVGDVRDTDWYTFEVTEKSTVTWTVHSRIPAQTIIVNDLCGDDLAFVGYGMGHCPSIVETCLEAGTYRAFVGADSTGNVPCGTGEYVEYAAALVVTPVETCPGFDTCVEGNAHITQNSDMALTDAGVWCPAGINWSARSYDLSVGASAGLDMEITCVEYGVASTGGQFPAKVAVYLDTDGGVPQAPGIDMELLGERDTVIAYGANIQSAGFDPPICVPADSVIVVTLYFDASGITAGGVSFDGNATPADGPTYLMSSDCGLAVFTDLAAIGFPDSHWVQTLVANDVCGGGGTPCPGDFNDDGDVNGGDFGQLLANWGSCPGCPQDLNGDGDVNGADVGLMLSYWGLCTP